MRLTRAAISFCCVSLFANSATSTRAGDDAGWRTPPPKWQRSIDFERGPASERNSNLEWSPLTEWTASRPEPTAAAIESKLNPAADHFLAIWRAYFTPCSAPAKVQTAPAAVEAGQSLPSNPPRPERIDDLILPPDFSNDRANRLVPADIPASDSRITVFKPEVRNVPSQILLLGPAAPRAPSDSSKKLVPAELQLRSGLQSPIRNPQSEVPARAAAIVLPSRPGISQH